jgi:hypothetical protein
MNSAFGPMTPLTATVSGSFKRHLAAIQEVVESAPAHGVVILSPADPHIVDSFGEFVFVSSDRRRSIKGIQSRHLDAIRQSDFLWLVCPDGYVGQSAAMELGYAVSAGVPIFADVAPMDWTLRQYVTPVGSFAAACVALRNRNERPASAADSLLVAPEPALAAIRADLDEVEHSLLTDRSRRVEDPTEDRVRRIRRLLALPGVR